LQHPNRFFAKRVPRGVLRFEMVVAVFDTSEDTTDMLRQLFEHRGFVVVTAFTHDIRDGKTELEALMRQHRPDVIVYDVALPYEENWRLFQHIRTSPCCQDIPFVVTTTNETQVRKVAGDEPVLEIVGKPYDLDQLVAKVTAAAGFSKQ
jgi:CheY-like chemotaxis protein